MTDMERLGTLFYVCTGSLLNRRDRLWRMARFFRAVVDEYPHDIGRIDYFDYCWLQQFIEETRGDYSI